MTYSEAIQFLYSLRWFGTKLGLEHTIKLAALVGNPHQGLRFIHVAGTNGKGSTCAMLESVYRQAGLRVGLFTSPHLVSFSERIQINRQLIPEAQVVTLVERVQRCLREFSADHHPTFFEVVTVMALVFFAENNCDLVVWETGLGGRLDATNIVTPLASVISNVQLDHQQWLGDTLPQIAHEKAGIIKPGIPVITTTEVPSALEVIARVACENNAPLTLIRHAAVTQPPLDTLELPLKGEHQRMNAALAVATVQALQHQMPVTEACLREGLKRVQWAGRLQVETTPTGQILVLDGAHNPAGAGTLRAAIKQYFPQARPVLILGMLRDKDWMTMCEILAPLADQIYLVPVHSERTAAPEELRGACQKAHATVAIHPVDSLSQALAQSAADPLVVVTGSLYLIGEAIELLHLVPQPHTDERRLNEWGASCPARSV
jgi:dihydrofolate synthase/folylpolyglutamate synthase